MKHIKKYENYSSYDIKKYAVIKYINTDNNNIDYFIDEIEEIRFNKYVFYNMLYQYNYDTNIIDKLKTENIASLTIKRYIEDILFTSDNLNDCVNFIIQYIQANKYNL